MAALLDAMNQVRQRENPEDLPERIRLWAEFRRKARELRAELHRSWDADT